jgi:hypothetical protein
MKGLVRHSGSEQEVHPQGFRRGYGTEQGSGVGVVCRFGLKPCQHFGVERFRLGLQGIQARADQFARSPGSAASRSS